MAINSTEFAALQAWCGRREQRSDLITAAPVSALAATLDQECTTLRSGDPLPPLYHWLYFLPVVPISQIGVDGHPARGGFLPPVPLPRRMWAAGRLSFHHPLHIGETVTRTSEIIDIQLKQGKSGSLVFVKLRHVFSGEAGAAAIVEEQDLVYRDNPSPNTGTDAIKGITAPDKAAWRREIIPSPVLLFRYSALTFNNHRIHYDYPYATNVEGYPGLVVHGPLLATLLADHFRRQLPEAKMTKFEFRAQRPVYDLAPFELCAEPAVEGNSIKLWTQDADRMLCMDASATFESNQHP